MVRKTKPAPWRQSSNPALVRVAYLAFVDGQADDALHLIKLGVHASLELLEVLLELLPQHWEHSSMCLSCAKHQAAVRRSDVSGGASRLRRTSPAAAPNSVCRTLRSPGSPCESAGLFKVRLVVAPSPVPVSPLPAPRLRPLLRPLSRVPSVSAPRRDLRFHSLPTPLLLT